MKNKKKKIFLSICSITLCVALIIGVSFAVFTDKVEFNNNFLSTSKVEISATINGSSDSIELESIDQGYEEDFTVQINNSSTTTIAYRFVFTVSGDTDLLEYVTFSLGEETLLFEDSRAITDWINGITKTEKLITTTLKIKLANSLPNKMQNKTLGFNFVIEAMQDNFVVVNNQTELNSVVKGEYVKLSNTFAEDTVEINKDIYLDLNNLELKEINIVGANIYSVEIVNGKSELLNVDAPNATVYVYAEITKEIYANTSTNSLYYNGKQTSDVVLNITVYGGHASINSNATLVLTVEAPLVNSNPVSITTTKETVIESLVVTKEATQEISLDIKGEVKELDVQNDDANLNFEKELPIHQDLLVISNVEGVTKNIAINGVLYQTVTVSLEDALSSDKTMLYFEEGTYQFDEVFEINRDMILFGMGEVKFVKGNSNAFLEDTLVFINSDVKVSIDGIQFIDNTSSDENSCAIFAQGNNDIEILNCSFDLFPKNGVTVKGGTLFVEGCTFTYTQNISSTPNAIQIDNNATAQVSNCVFNGFVSTTKYSATGILVLRGASVHIESNEFNNCKEGISIANVYSVGYDACEFTEVNNTFNDCGIGLVTKDKGYLITKDGYTNWYYQYIDDATGYAHYYDVVGVYDTISKGLVDYHEIYTTNPSVIAPVFLVFEGTYVEATKKQNGNPIQNVYIKAPLTLKGLGNVIITTDNKNEAGTAQQIILIESDNVVLDNLNIYTTTATSNSSDKAIEIRKGSNIVIKNCNLHYGKLGIGVENVKSSIGIMIQGSSIGKYTIINNTINNMDISIVIGNNAGILSNDSSVISNNVFNSGIQFIGKVNSGWNYSEVESFPIIENNVIGLSKTTINDVEVSYYLYSISAAIDMVASDDVFLQYVSKNNLSTSIIKKFEINGKNEINYIKTV